MAEHQSTEEMIAGTRNLSRLAVENQPLVWMFLMIILVAGIFSYRGLPQRKDPDIPNKIAAIACPWPGASPEKVDELVARKIEAALSLKQDGDKVKSVSRTRLLVTTVGRDAHFK